MITMPGVARPASEVRLTRIKSCTPSVLSKRYYLKADGSLGRSTSANMVAGQAIPVAISGPESLVDLLVDLGPDEALVYGVVADKTIGLVSQKKWLELGRPDDPQPRTKEAFRWPAGPGVLLLDYDPAPNERALTRVELVNALRSAVSGLADAAMVWWPSSSSHICNGDNDLTGLKGQRIYMLVQDARDISRAGEALKAHLLAAGHCQAVVSKSGQILIRTLIDTSVWQQNRLDFAAGAVCDPPLQQQRGKPVIIDGGVVIINSVSAIPDPPPLNKAEAEANKAKARAEAAEYAAIVRNCWAEERKAQIIERLATSGQEITEETTSQISSTVKRAVENKTLTGDFDITIVEDGQSYTVTVGEILDNPLRYHGRQTRDPLEPDYDGGRLVGKLFLVGSRPNLYSFAHGGANFRLERQPTRIELVKGKTYDATLQTLALLKNQPDIFDYGDNMVLVEGSKVFPLDDAHLRHCLGGIAQYWAHRRSPSGKLYVAEEDPPTTVCRNILAMTSLRNLKKLEAVITAPTIRTDGTVLSALGYDETTCLLLNNDAPVHVPDMPTQEQVQTAIKRLMRPFELFPFVTPQDRGVLLAALLTASIRATLPTAPGFGFDAPVQGSGKTLLACCVAILGTGQEPSVWPYTGDKSDEEIRKRIFAALRSGSQAIVLDNIIGMFQSAAMAAALTWPIYQDRVLGKSESSAVPNKALFLLTGNNMCLAGDMPRRVLTCRIDPMTEKPYAREFDLDPSSYTLTHRIGMVEAALTIIRGWLNSGSSRAAGRMASFELWDDLVRQPVAWVNREISPGEYCDPMDAVNSSQMRDPEQEQLLELLVAWEEAFGHHPVTTKMVLDRITNVPDSNSQRLCDAITDIYGSVPNARSLGRVLGYRKDRVVGGKRLETPSTKDGSQLWRVKAT